MTALITLNPIDPGTDTRVTVRLCATQDPADTGADGQIWWPAIIAQPVLQARLFDGDFTSGVDNGSASFTVALGVLMRSGAFPRVERYDWAGAEVTIQRRNGGSLQTLATMKVDTFASEAGVLSLRLAAATQFGDTDVLAATYAGTGGAEGGADLKGQVKPWVFGRALNVEPVFIDQIDNVFQVSGYGPVQAITAVYERGSSFGASVGDFASYAALVGATIPAGRWGTCLAQGMIRLGAPPAGVITVDVDGDNTGGFLRRTGAIIEEIADRLGLSGNINAASLAALDTAVARNVNILIAGQISFFELVQRMVAPCNAVPGIAPDGKLIVSRVVFGTEQFTLDAQGREMPPVLGMVRQNTSAPYKRIQMGAAQSWRVHSFDEIAFYSEIIDKGAYDAATVYREGNIVSSVDKTRWIYSNPTPASGNAPPTWPTTSNAYWSSLEGPASDDPAIANSNVVLSGDLADLPPAGDYDGQTYAAEDTLELYRWDQSTLGWVPVSDITATAQRSIEAQFPVIEIKEGEAGNVGTRTVTHVAKRGTVTLTGGTWSLPSTNVPGSTITINSTTGTVSLSGVAISGAYTVRYTHTDGIVTELPINVTYMPEAAAPVTVIRNESATTTAGTANNNLWQTILSLTVTGAPAGLTNLGSFGRSRLTVSSGTGTADFEARLLLNGVEVASVASQNVVTGGVISPTDFTDLFDDSYSTSAGNVTFTIELRRTSGTGTITATNTRLDVTIIA
jgi:hypothetical protein